MEIQNWNGRSKNRADWEKSFKQVKVRIGLHCLLRSRSRRGRRGRSGRRRRRRRIKRHRSSRNGLVIFVRFKKNS
jgi:hypothetical protein